MEKIFYFAHIFNSLHCIATVLTVIGIGFTLILGIRIAADFDFDEREIPGFKKLVKYTLTILITGILGLTFCPTKQTYLFMAGGRVIEEVVESNPQLKEIPDNTVDLLNEYIKLETEKIRNKKQ